MRGYRSRSTGLLPLVEQHAEIYRGIVERDARRAAASMRRHLLSGRSSLKAAFALGPARVGRTDG